MKHQQTPYRKELYKVPTANVIKLIPDTCFLGSKQAEAPEGYDIDQDDFVW